MGRTLGETLDNQTSRDDLSTTYTGTWQSWSDSSGAAIVRGAASRTVRNSIVGDETTSPSRLSVTLRTHTIARSWPSTSRDSSPPWTFSGSPSRSSSTSAAISAARCGQSLCGRCDSLLVLIVSGSASPRFGSSCQLSGTWSAGSTSDSLPVEHPAPTAATAASIDRLEGTTSHFARDDDTSCGILPRPVGLLFRLNWGRVISLARRD